MAAKRSTRPGFYDGDCVASVGSRRVSGSDSIANRIYTHQPGAAHETQAGLIPWQTPWTRTPKREAPNLPRSWTSPGVTAPIRVHADAKRWRESGPGFQPGPPEGNLRAAVTSTWLRLQPNRVHELRLKPQPLFLREPKALGGKDSIEIGRAHV